MIFLDFSQVIIGNIFASLNLQTDINERLIRKMVLKSIRGYKNKFGQEFGQLIICCDSHKYWCRDSFAYYKSNRKNDRDQSGLDWDFIFKTINQIKKELIETFPYKVFEIEGAEADDIISVLTEYLAHEKCLIISSDKDFIQLLNENVSIYAPSQNILRSYMD